MVFQLFHTRTSNHDETESCNSTFITPYSASWDPHAIIFSSSEQSMVDWEGNMEPKNYRKKHIIDYPVLATVINFSYNYTLDVDI